MLRPLSLHSVAPFVLAVALLLSGSAAQASCETPLGRSIQAKVSAAVEGDTLSSNDVFLPLLEYARDHAAEISVSDEGEYDGSEVFHALRKELASLQKAGCIDPVTGRYYSALTERMTYSSPTDVVFSKETLEKWPSLQVYWVNRAHFETLLAAKYPEADGPKRIEDARALVRGAYVRKMDGLGKIAIYDSVMLRYTRSEINEIAQVLVDTLDVMTSESGQIVLRNSRRAEAITLELTPADIARVAGNYFDREARKARLGAFRTKPFVLADAVVAAFLTGDIDADVLAALLKNRRFKEPKKNFLKAVGKTTWTLGQAVLYQVPVTYPFIVLGSLVFDAIERKKENEKAESDASHLIH